MRLLNLTERLRTQDKTKGSIFQLTNESEMDTIS